MKQISKKVLVALCAASMATTCFSSVAFAGYTVPMASTSTFSTSDENIIAVLQPKYINSGLSDLIAEAGIVLSSVDQIYVVNQSSTTRPPRSMRLPSRRDYPVQVPHRLPRSPAGFRRS